jgi:dCTP deaminase
MILVDEEIKEAVNSGEVELSDFSKECLQPASYDLRVGEEGFVLSAGRVINIQTEGPLEIQPGDFALIMTHEKLRLPTNIVGRFGLRSMYARMGLLATAGPQVDPGFEGKLVIGVVNFSSQTVRMPYLTPFCTLELERLSRHSSVAYGGPYQGQEHLTDELTKMLPKEPFPLAVMLIRQLAAVSPSLRHLETLTLPRQLGIFEQEREAFERLKPELLKTHRGQYVVVRGGKAVLFGQDKTKLARQAYEQFGYGPLYIGLVEKARETVHIPTPRASRRMA